MDWFFTSPDLIELSKIASLWHPRALGCFTFYDQWDPYIALLVGFTLTWTGLNFGFRMITAYRRRTEKYQLSVESILKAYQRNPQNTLRGLQLYFGFMMVLTACGIPPP